MIIVDSSDVNKQLTYNGLKPDKDYALVCVISTMLGNKPVSIHKEFFTPKEESGTLNVNFKFEQYEKGNSYILTYHFI